MPVEPIRHANEPRSNRDREIIARSEPRSLRTFTPSQAVISRSAGVYHWTADGRRLYDYTSGVLVSNLGHNPVEWQKRFAKYMGWEELPAREFFEAVPLTAYNAITAIEADAVRRLTANLKGCPGGGRMEQVLWAASGSEAVQKALWSSLAVDPRRTFLIATRDGFHGKKGLAEAVTGSEKDKNRDPRVRFISFPKKEREDVSQRKDRFDPAPYAKELEQLEKELGGDRIAALITEPYLGGSGSYHPPKEYLQLLQEFCRRNNAVYILDEIQANFGRTGNLYAFETYGIEPDIVVLGKGLGNGVPASAAVGRADVLGALDYGEGSDTFSANPLCCAAVLATLDEFESRDVLGHTRKVSAIIERKLLKLKEIAFVRFVRGEEGGMVWGVEVGEFGGRSDNEVANACVEAAYLGDAKGRAVHLMGPLANKILRIAPPLTITEAEAAESMETLDACFRALEQKLGTVSVPATQDR